MPSMCAQLCTDFGAVFHSAGWCEGSGASRRAPRELGALSSWQTLIKLTGTFQFSLGASSTACEARMGMLVLRQILIHVNGNLTPSDASLYGLLVVEVRCCLSEGLLAFCSLFFS